MEYQFAKLTNPNTATEHQLTAAIEHNSRTYYMMSREVDNIRKVTAAAKAKGKNQPVVILEENQPKIQEAEQLDQDFEEEVEYYISEVKGLTAEQLETELATVLPSRKHYEYERILRRLQIELLKECKDIKDFFGQEKTARTPEFQEFIDELNLNMAKVKAIGAELVKKTELSEEEEKKENTLIFVPTSGGNIRILDDIDSIDPIQYRRFEQLFRSIKDGTFKNVKKFNDNNNVTGLTEVRDLSNGGRVTFMRLDDSTYAIISAFIKKTTNSNGYQRMLANQCQSYRAVEDQIRANLTNPEFLELQSGYEQELFRKLNPTAINKPTVMKKVGE